jgi:hypothetical protein
MSAIMSKKEAKELNEVISPKSPVEHHLKV